MNFAHFSLRQNNSSVKVMFTSFMFSSSSFQNKLYFENQLLQWNIYSMCASLHTQTNVSNMLQCNIAYFFYFFEKRRIFILLVAKTKPRTFFESSGCQFSFGIMLLRLKIMFKYYLIFNYPL